MVVNASPRADAMALVNRKIPITSDFIFLGAFVKAYSRPVIDAKISESAINTYLAVVLSPLHTWVK